MFKKFALQGNRECIRTDDEMLMIDKSAADSAFEKYSKELLGKYLTGQGFRKWKTRAYVRRNPIDLLEYIDIQKERYGSKTFTINYAIMPLYVPAEYMIIGFGDRLGTLISGKDIWWDYAADEIAKVSFQNVVQAISQLLLPWFQKYSEECNYKKRLEKDVKRPFCGYDSQLWLEALDGCEEKERVILETIHRLKLPKGLMG